MKQMTMKQTREALALLSIVDMMHVEGLAAGTVNENAARIEYKAQGGRPVRYIHISSRARKVNLDAIAAAVAEAIGAERWAEIVTVVTGEETETEETTAPAEEQTAETTENTETEEEEEEQNMKPEYKHIYVEEARRQLEARQDRSAWDRAVTEDAIDLLDTVNDRCEQVTRQFAETEEGSAAHVHDLFVSRVSLMDIMKNGAESWHDYSWGGCGLIYDGDIAEHYCTPSELKKVHGGERRPNSREEWLDVQARALRQAAGRAADALIAASHKTYTVKGV